MLAQYTLATLQWSPFFFEPVVTARIGISCHFAVIYFYIIGSRATQDAIDVLFALGQKSRLNIVKLGVQRDHAGLTSSALVDQSGKR